MNHNAIARALLAYQQAHHALIKAVLEELTAPVAPFLTEETQPPAPPKRPREHDEPVVPTVPTRTRPAAPVARRPAVEIPTLGNKAKHELTDETRAENLPAAIEIATKVVELLGDTLGQAQLLDAVQSQLALKRIPFDRTLVTQALASAQR